MKAKMSFKTQTKYLQHRGVEVDKIIKSQKNFELASMKERWALQQVMPKITLGKDHHIAYTPTYSYDTYDAVLQFLNNGSFSKTYLIEAKIRDKHYPELMLEKKKYTAIKNALQDKDDVMVYIVFTPEGTFVFNLSKMELPHITYIECPKETMGDTTEINKPVYLLPVESAKRIDWIYSDTEYVKSTIKKTPKVQGGPFDDLFSK